MKSAEEIMEILNAYDLTGSLRDAGELAGCSHHTVKRYVDRRSAAGELDLDVHAARLDPLERHGDHPRNHELGISRQPDLSTTAARTAGRIKNKNRT